MIERITIESAPKNIAPYVHAVRAGQFYFITGQMPIVPGTEEYELGSIELQTSRVMENLLIILSALGLSIDSVVQVRAFLTNMNDFDRFNAVYKKFFGNGLPARTCVGVSGLAGGASVEVDMIAFDDKTLK